jgi:CRISPR-associated protein Csm4
MKGGRMPALSIYQIYFPGGLHIGTRGVDLDDSGVSIPSDTLFSALVDAWSRMGGDVSSFIQPFLQTDPAETGDNGFDPPFLLSSAFPFVGGVRFFPVPVAPMRLFSPAVAAKRVDDINNIHFISQGLLELALQGKVLDEYLFPESERELPEKGIGLQQGELWLTREEAESLGPIFDRAKVTGDELRGLRYRRIWSIGRIPRVTVDRIKQASTIFHAGRVSFASGCGLWFGIYWRNADAPLGNVTYRQAIDDCLQMLSDDGTAPSCSPGRSLAQPGISNCRRTQSSVIYSAVILPGVIRNP